MRGDMFFRDLDTGKAIQIYANSRMEGGESLIALGRAAEAVTQLRIAEMISPELAPTVDAMLGASRK